jgi:multiple sugar transport system substrate-binding protein
MTTRWTRRAVLGTSATAVGAGLLGAGTLRAQAPAVLRRGSKVTYWGGLIFSDKANRLLRDTITAWGQANGITTEVVMINQNETVQKVSAAVAAGSMPDALDLGNDLLQTLARQGVFVPVDDIFARVGAAQGGWFEAVARATDTTATAGARTGLPYGASGNMIFRRADVLDPAGLKTPPRTWEELVAQAAAVTRPPFFGLGLALSNVGDGNLQMSVLHAHGGRIADDTGTTAAIDSPETRSYLRWVEDAWDRKVFPPGVVTWDGAGDNQAYLSGQVAFIANTGSVAIAAKSQDPELYKGTAFSPLPAGPKGTFSPIGPNLRAVPKTSQNQEAAKALLEHLAQPEFMNAYFEVAIYGPVLQGQAKLPAFDGRDPVLAGLLELIRTGTAPGYPDVYNAAFADASSNFVVPKMVQRVVIDGWDPDRAIAEAQRQIQAIYDKYR